MANKLINMNDSEMLLFIELLSDEYEKREENEPINIDNVLKEVFTSE